MTVSLATVRRPPPARDVPAPWGDPANRSLPRTRGEGVGKNMEAGTPPPTDGDLGRSLGDTVWDTRRGPRPAPTLGVSLNRVPAKTGPGTPPIKKICSPEVGPPPDTEWTPGPRTETTGDVWCSRIRTSVHEAWTSGGAAAQVLGDALVEGSATGRNLDDVPDAVVEICMDSLRLEGACRRP
jgi:hypothetical protein